MKPIDCLTDKGTIKVYAKWLKAGIISADSCEAKQIDGGSYNVKYNKTAIRLQAGTMIQILKSQ